VLGFSILSPNMELYNYLDTNIAQYHSFNEIYTSDTVLGALDGTLGVKPMGEHFTDKAIKLIDKIIPDPPRAEILVENWTPGNLKSGSIDLKIEFNESVTDYNLYKYKNGEILQLAKLDFASAFFGADDKIRSSIVNVSYSQIEGERLELFISKSLEQRDDISMISWQIPYIEETSPLESGDDIDSRVFTVHDDIENDDFEIKFEGYYSALGVDYTLQESNAKAYSHYLIGCYLYPGDTNSDPSSDYYSDK